MSKEQGMLVSGTEMPPGFRRAIKNQTYTTSQ